MLTRGRTVLPVTRSPPQHSSRGLHGCLTATLFAFTFSGSASLPLFAVATGSPVLPATPVYQRDLELDAVYLRVPA